MSEIDSPTQTPLSGSWLKIRLSNRNIDLGPIGENQEHFQLRVPYARKNIYGPNFIRTPGGYVDSLTLLVAQRRKTLDPVNINQIRESLISVALQQQVDEEDRRQRYHARQNELLNDQADLLLTIRRRFIKEEEEPLDLSSIEAQARAANISGLDLLPFHPGVLTFFKRTLLPYFDNRLPTLNDILAADPLFLAKIPELGLKKMQTFYKGIANLQSLTPEEIHEKIAQSQPKK
jgi:hypothetical protein